MKSVRILNPALVKYTTRPSIQCALVIDLSHKAFIGVHMSMKPRQPHRQKATTRNIATQHDIANRFPGNSRIYSRMMETFDKDNEIVYMGTLA